jgi:hypothetical protein
LSPEFNLYGIYDDGTSYTTGGLDGAGYSYSANLLGASRVLNKTLMDFGPADQLSAVGCNGQVVTLPLEQYSSLVLAGTGIQGNQTSQTLTVNYTDGSHSQFTQSFSDWFTPQKYPGESSCVVMAYRNASNGTRDRRIFNLYAYRFALDPTRVVQSIGLPSDPDVVVLAATLVP